MSKNFDDNYDRLMFCDFNNSCFDGVTIEELYQKYIMSDKNLDAKKYFVKLKDEYIKIKKIENYQRIQETLYANKDRAEILSFELSRILKQNPDNPKILERIASVQSILSSYKGNIPDDSYVNIVDTIIYLELHLGMKIGLFNEVCLIFESKLQEVLMAEGKNYKRK